MKNIVTLFGVIVALCYCAQPAVFAQAKNDAWPAHVVTKLFEGMAKGDSAMVHSTFGPKVRLVTIYRTSTNKPVIEYEDSIDDFLRAVGTPHKEAWHEEIWNVKVEVDGDLAQVWCDYAFYLGNTFSHCGVDAFQLHRTEAGWKIFQLSDTRRKSDCKVPQSISHKHQE